MTAGKTAEQSRVNCIIIRLSLSVSEAIGKLSDQKMSCNDLIARPDTVETDDKSAIRNSWQKYRQTA